METRKTISDETQKLALQIFVNDTDILGGGFTEEEVKKKIHI